MTHPRRHLSHIMQPPDLAPFAVTKSSCRTQTEVLSSWRCRTHQEGAILWRDPIGQKIRDFYDKSPKLAIELLVFSVRH